MQKKFQQGKYVSVIKGKILDVVVDLRKNSKTFGQHFSIKIKHDSNFSIYIPENFDYIEILGGVAKPGRYAYSKDHSYLDYLELAGGLTKNATRKKFIIKAGTGQRLPLNNTLKIEKGDILFIPDKLEYNTWQVFKDVLSTLGSIGALIIVIQNAGGG